MPERCIPTPEHRLPGNGAAVHRLLSFLDAYSSYNQIRMDPRNEEKMTFIIKSANFGYKVKPFGLKNAKATY